MKIVDYDTFVRMPAGTIFAPWSPYVMEELPEIKIDPGKEYTINFGRSIEKRWMFNGTCPIVPYVVQDEGFDYGPVHSEFFYYDGDSNDAMGYTMFLIFEKDDIENMIKVLQWAKDGCPGTDDPNEMLRKGENND